MNEVKIIRQRDKADKVVAFDFSTLYMKIPDNKVLNVTCELIDFCFDGGAKIHVTVTKYGAK